MVRRLLVALVVLGALGAGLPAAATVLHSYAIVREDGSLQVQGQAVHLFGIYLPPTERICRTHILPIRCAPRSVIALADRIRGFVRCEVVGANRGGELEAVCFIRGATILEPEIDLGAWLLEQGWAVATPEAPFEYAVLERIAQSRGLGVWGFQADEIRPHRGLRDRRFLRDRRLQLDRFTWRGQRERR